MNLRTLFSLIVFVAVISVPAALAQDATPDGAMVYSYPIELPPGLGGLTPNVSLEYNSMSGNSLLGVGFRLGGLSAITRDQSYGINFTEGDHFLIDGQRLFKTSDGMYHTERESFELIECVGDPNDTSSHWVVTAKNGTKLYYGYNLDEHDTTNDGRIEAVGMDGKALVWALSRVEDTNGNYYTIDYLEDATEGDYYPTKIEYTKNEYNSGLKTHAVYFSYEPRTDATVLYLPTPFKMDMRLKWITVKT
ncbi:MAG TPA: hypothetical protein ENN69_08755, partial [Spirochaetia bacterium]|nr:hypothetical protein [Spirochaetia bacterium]